MTDNPKKKRPIYTRFAGPILLETPLLNKGSAFSMQEKRRFNLEGLLPATIETIEEQAKRSYQQYCQSGNDLDKHIFLRNIQDTNETLFFRLIIDHLEEMMPIIYTPTVGLACQRFSQIYRRNRGIFIAYTNKNRIDDMLQNATKQKVKVIVVTDSERILGLGDQGIGGMGIPIGKLALYSACGGISPAYVLPVTLDVGTNNQQLLDDPMYMGLRQKRIAGEKYFEFVDLFIQSVQQRWPNALIQFEDFAQANATPLLKKYQDKICCFNDDIQGTAAVTVGTLLAACYAQDTKLKDHRVVFVGAGSAGCGIAEQIVSHMQEDGISEEQAISQVFLLGIDGLLTDDMPLLDFQKKFSRPKEQILSWSSDGKSVNLLDLVKATKPTILIGVSGVPNLMTEEIVRTMYTNCPTPIILPLSNPTSRVEALPSDVIQWTDGKAVVATGSPFDPVTFQGKSYPIAQCNNSYIFPGIGLGVIASKAKRVTNEMFMTASKALAECSPLVKEEGEELLPALHTIRDVSKHIAIQVGLKAMEQGVATKVENSVLEAAIVKNFWLPEYREYRRTSF